MNGTHYILITDTDLKGYITQAVAEAFKDLQSLYKTEDKLLTQVEAAEILRVSIPTLNAMKAKGLIPYTQVHGKIYFFKNDIMESLKAIRNNVKSIIK